MTSKTKKTILWIVASVCAVIVLLGAVFCFAFVSTDPQLKPGELSPGVYFTGAKITQSVLYRAYKSKKESEIKTLKISNTEMQHLMVMAENGESLLYLITGRKPKSPDGKNEMYNIDYDRGIYYFKVKLTDTFCGLCFVASGSMKIGYSDEEIDIEILSLKIGRVELTVDMKENIKQEILQYLKNESAYEIIRASVKNVHYDPDGTVRIKYYPYRLRKYMKNM